MKAYKTENSKIRIKGSRRELDDEGGRREIGGRSS